MALTEKNMHFGVAKSESCPQPIEILWHDLKRAVHSRHPNNISELTWFCKDKWSKIPPDRCAGLIRSDRQCLVEVIAAKGRVNQLLNPRVHIHFPPCTVNVYTVRSINK